MTAPHSEQESNDEEREVKKKANAINTIRSQKYKEMNKKKSD